MSLQPAFSQPIADAQYSFRRILKALSEPGVRVQLPSLQGFGQLDSATTGVLLTLVDAETPLWIAPGLSDDILLSNLRFHTGVVITDSPNEASFVLTDSSLTTDILLTFCHGDEMSPERSTSVIVQLSSLNDGTSLCLSGPGIATQRIVSPRLPESLIAYLLNRPQRFPLGLDFLLTCGEHVIAIPRTTHVEVC